jgi:hypothetical protein
VAGDFTIGIGTVGAGLWFSYDGGGAWRHIQKRINPEGNVRALQVDPQNAKRILAVSDRTGIPGQRRRRLPLGAAVRRPR